jgi:hypothetical protein
LIIFSVSGFSLFDPHEGLLVKEYSLNLEIDPQVQPFIAQERAVLADKKGGIFELTIDQEQPLLSQLLGGRARLTSLAASEDYISAGHASGLMLMNSRGHVVWSNDDMEPVSVAPLIAGDSVFALDDRGNGLLFDTLRSNPVIKTKMLNGEVCTHPLMTRSTIAAVSADGEVSALSWR